LKANFPILDLKGMVAALDESVRQLVTTLKRKGLYDNSVIIFTTDNGAASGGLDMSAGSNYPLRGVKNTLWEGGVRGVAFVHSPLIKRKSKYPRQIEINDFF
jgi:arylsulfatase A-like enzyme